MLPIVLDAARLKIGLAGEGAAAAKRFALLRAAGVEPIALVLGASEGLEKLNLLYIAGMDGAAAVALAGRARALGVLVNVEDEPALCDFHVPATVRRGALLVTVSTGGRSPGLVSILREWLAARLGDDWAGRVERAGRRRAEWRAEGLAPVDVAARTRALVEAEKWLA